jgi:hypothetical protein
MRDCPRGHCHRRPRNDLATGQPKLAQLFASESDNGMTKPPPELLEFLYRYDPGVQLLALGLRKVVHEEMAPCHEYIFEMRSKVVLLYGATERVIADGMCNIGVFARHVTLGFPRGVDLEDPAGLLQGTGKAMRHIRLKTLSDLDRAEIRRYLRQARKRAGIQRRRHGTAAAVVTRVKPKSLARPPAWPKTFW